MHVTLQQAAYSMLTLFYVDTDLIHFTPSPTLQAHFTKARNTEADYRLRVRTVKMHLTGVIMTFVSDSDNFVDDPITTAVMTHLVDSIQRASVSSSKTSEEYRISSLVILEEPTFRFEYVWTSIMKQVNGQRTTQGFLMDGIDRLLCDNK